MFALQVAKTETDGNLEVRFYSENQNGWIPMDCHHTIPAVDVENHVLGKLQEPKLVHLSKTRVYYKFDDLVNQ